MSRLVHLMRPKLISSPGNTGMFVITSDQAPIPTLLADKLKFVFTVPFLLNLGEDYHPPEVTDAISSVYRSSGEKTMTAVKTVKDRLPPNKANQPHSVTTNTPGSGADNPLVGSNPTVEPIASHCSHQEALPRFLAVA